MSIISATCEIDDMGGGRFRSTYALKPIAYLRDGTYRRMGHAFGATADLSFPMGVDDALLVKLDSRIAGKSPLFEIRGPDRSKLARFALLNANNVAAVATKANEYTFPNAMTGADLVFAYGGWKVSADFVLKKGHPKTIAWRMDEQVGFDPKAMMLGDLIMRQPVLLPPNDRPDALPVSLRWDITSKGGKYELTCVLPDGDWAGWTLDPTLTLQPADGVDTMLRDATPDTNMGTANFLRIGRFPTPQINRCLLAFDLSSVPAAALCSSATLSLYVQYPYSGGAHTHNTYRVKRAWAELQATWNVYSTGNSWGVAGCADAVNDRESTNLGSCSYAGNEGSGTEKTYTLVAGLVQGWWDGSIDNNGLLVQSNDETGSKLMDMASSAYAAPALRPKLVIDYTLPGGLLAAMQRYPYSGGTL